MVIKFAIYTTTVSGINNIHPIIAPIISIVLFIVLYNIFSSFSISLAGAKFVITLVA